MNALSSIASLSVEPNRIRALTLDRIQAASATDEVIKGTIEMVLKRCPEKKDDWANGLMGFYPHRESLSGRHLAVQE